MNSGINSKTEKIFQFFWTAFFILITVIAMVPILRVISVSFSSKDAITAGRVFVFPVGFNTEAYSRALQSGSFVRAFGYSIVLMLGSTAVNLLMTVLAAYPLSKKAYEALMIQLEKKRAGEDTDESGLERLV